MLHEERLKFLAALDERLEGSALHTQTKIDRKHLHVYAVRRQRLDVTVVDETDAVEVHNLLISNQNIFACVTQC